MQILTIIAFSLILIWFGIWIILSYKIRKYKKQLIDLQHESKLLEEQINKSQKELEDQLKLLKNRIILKEEPK